MNTAQLTKPSRIPIEQSSDPTILIFKRKMSSLPSDEQILLNDACYLHYARHKNRNIISNMMYFADNFMTISRKNEVLDRCRQLALRQPFPGKQLILMTDVSFQTTGCAVLIEDDPNQKHTSSRKTYAPKAYGSKTNTPSQIKMSMYVKHFFFHLHGL